MNQTDKLATALRAVLDNTQQIADAKAQALELEGKRDNIHHEAVRVIKSSGKDQVLFRGTIFKLGTDPKEDEGNITLEISTFDGLVLEDDSGDNNNNNND